MELRAMKWDRIAKAKMIFGQKFGKVMVEDEDNAEYASIKIDGYRYDRIRLEKLADVP